ncbi:hypothetical protein BAUCODRAFT_29319 [Baudoinia panamericana UAMH 10762]|uniref:Uncharacterized protein n=1 Tax=Baudoinia panamericana (strain UAMH 10762) TaxID=717646 RepID=M2MVE1_BAUPA|nr:uncharacterized protein BAUCODRAFT_29319 [Baudoinia panamericana UAMH 10762]EMD00937.1 hypothetical protein BAUCODRAFT_29319 [Baudoinia panamericana UAMH 10762]
MPTQQVLYVNGVKQRGGKHVYFDGIEQPASKPKKVTKPLKGILKNCFTPPPAPARKPRRERKSHASHDGWYEYEHTTRKESRNGRPYYTTRSTYRRWF